MKRTLWALNVVFNVAVYLLLSPTPAHGGTLLERLTWIGAEKALTPDAVVVIPLGGAAKEHGPHLPLNVDWLQAEFYKGVVLQKADVVIAPTVGYHYYPAFLEYPGSVSVGWRPAKYLIMDICRSLAGYGPKRFYVINTGVSTTPVLAEAAEELVREGIILRYTDHARVVFPDSLNNTEGTHAGEAETSLMLAISPEVVDMSRAVRDFNPDGGKLTRVRNGAGTFSPTGIWGDATRATAEKGRAIADAYIRAILGDIEDLRHASVPSAARTGSP